MMRLVVHINEKNASLLKITSYVIYFYSVIILCDNKNLMAQSFTFVNERVSCFNIKTEHYCGSAIIVHLAIDGKLILNYKIDGNLHKKILEM